ncbi:uncharacterized protein SOCEGT47_020210 [Sorangium cellulosum]|uniref:VOC domain-containing protein n=1 Tax=Sorangium cellulosum TaxID=56 RepID=A0A4P2PXD8_SORCE|nr:hypothetical protein [Sorangium cellulosum]AUX21535.1 uncharacterized protein SOCEGT47_020210 [Sorangium cellulosum]
MIKVQIRLRVDSVRDAERYYCDELGLFEFYHDYGMETVSLVSRDNPSFFLILSAGAGACSDDCLFGLETKDCDLLFERLRSVRFETGGRLLSSEVFEYPLGKNVLLRDPSGNKFLIFEESI